MPRFTARDRLRLPAEFETALKRGRRLHEAPLTAVVLANSLAHARLGLAIAARAVPRAVARNRIKRQTRESFRAAASRLPALDIVILAKPGAGAARPLQLREALQSLWRKAETCAPR